MLSPHSPQARVYRSPACGLCSPRARISARRSFRICQPPSPAQTTPSSASRRRASTSSTRSRDSTRTTNPPLQRTRYARAFLFSPFRAFIPWGILSCPHIVAFWSDVFLSNPIVRLGDLPHARRSISLIADSTQRTSAVSSAAYRTWHPRPQTFTSSRCYSALPLFCGLCCPPLHRVCEEAKPNPFSINLTPTST